MVIDNQQKIYYNIAFMKLRRWQQKVIEEFPDIIKNYRKFILKAPTGAGKTVLASEIINEFYNFRGLTSTITFDFRVTSAA